MLLAKSCHAEFSLLETGTLMLGTLHEYRQTEIKQIADPDEGRLNFKISFDEDVVVERSWFNTLFGRSFYIGYPGCGQEPPLITFPGPLSATVQNMRHEYVDQHKIILNKGMEAKILRGALNSFIFCMSRVRKARDCIGIFPDYDDYWYLNEVAIQEFGYGIAKSLLKRIVEDHAKGIYIVPKDTPMEELSVGCSFREVTYMDRDIHITNGGGLTLEEFIPKIENIAFIKPPSFSREVEFRFQYYIISKGAIIEPLVNRLIVDASLLKSMAFKI